MANVYDARNSAQVRYDRWKGEVLDAHGRHVYTTDMVWPRVLSTDGTAVLAAMATTMANRYALSVTP